MPLTAVYFGPNSPKQQYASVAGLSGVVKVSQSQRHDKYISNFYWNAKRQKKKISDFGMNIKKKKKFIQTISYSQLKHYRGQTEYI